MPAAKLPDGMYKMPPFARGLDRSETGERAPADSARGGCPLRQVPKGVPDDGLHAHYMDQRDALVRFLRARGAADQAEDLVQELWLRISKAHDQVQDPIAYLFRAANNLMISHYRSAERTGRRDHEWSISGSEPDAKAIESALAARQLIDLAEKRLRGLGQRVLMVFVMFRVDGLPQKAIAARLGISLSAVEKDLQRAYRALADVRSQADAD